MTKFSKVAVSGYSDGVDRDTSAMLNDVDDMVKGLAKLSAKLRPRYKALKGKGTIEEFQEIQHEIRQFMKDNLFLYS